MNRLTGTTLAIATGGLVVLLAAGAAYAYGPADGTGTSDATTGTPSDFIITSKAATGGPLTPGGASQIITFTVANTTSRGEGLSNVAVIVANANGSTWSSTGDEHGCTAADYSVSAPSIAYGEIAGGCQRRRIRHGDHEGSRQQPGQLQERVDPAALRCRLSIMTLTPVASDELPTAMSRVVPGTVSIDQIIDCQLVRTLFQPVVHLDSGSVAGFEALTRGPVDTSLESPMALLAAANRVGRLGELDWLCRARAMEAAAAAALPDALSWLINVEPAGLTMDCPAYLVPAIEDARDGLRVIMEVVERDLRGNVLQLIQASDQARRDSWGVALDDVGADEGSLALLPFLRPDVVKLDMSLVRGMPTEQAAEITAGIRSYAERTGAVILAEGIETQANERLARVFGATYGQGYYYGRPATLPAMVPNPSHPIPLRQHLRPVDGRTPFEVLSRADETSAGAQGVPASHQRPPRDQGQHRSSSLGPARRISAAIVLHAREESQIRANLRRQRVDDRRRRAGRATRRPHLLRRAAAAR